MSTSNANFYLSLSSPTTFTASLATGVSLPHSAASPASPNTGAFGILVTDANGNPMAAGTTIAVGTTYSATLNGNGALVTTGCNGTGGPGASSPYTIQTSPAVTVGGDVVVVGFTAPTNAGTGTITITVTSPQSKSTTTIGIPVTIT